MGGHAATLYIEIEIDAPVDEVWARTQRPELHERARDLIAVAVQHLFRLLVLVLHVIAVVELTNTLDHDAIGGHDAAVDHEDVVTVDRGSQSGPARHHDATPTGHAQPGDHLIEKPTYSAFTHSKLAPLLDALHAVPKSSHRQSQARAAMRRAVEVLLAMQEPDGGFARFERGESEVFMTRFPLRDARLLAAGSPTDNNRVRVSAAALRQLGRLGFQADDDRIARGVQWLWQRVTGDMAGFDLATLGELGLCSATLCPPTHPLRQTIERQLRGRQREDGSFGSVVDTAAAMHALMALEGAVCIQTQRAARHLVHLLDSAPPELAQAELSERLGGEWTPGLGLTPMCHDPSAGVREAALALAVFRERGGQL